MSHDEKCGDIWPKVLFFCDIWSKKDGILIFQNTSFLLFSIILSRIRCAPHVYFYSFPKIFPKTIVPFSLCEYFEERNWRPKWQANLIIFRKIFCIFFRKNLVMSKKSSNFAGFFAWRVLMRLQPRKRNILVKLTIIKLTKQQNAYISR